MADNNSIISNIHNALDEWTRLDVAVREDAFIDVDLLDGSVNFIDADDFFKYDLEDSTERLSFYTLNPWDIVDYNEDTNSFSFRQDELAEIEKTVLKLHSEFNDA